MGCIWDVSTEYIAVGSGIPLWSFLSSPSDILGSSPAPLADSPAASLPAGAVSVTTAVTSASLLSVAVSVTTSVASDVLPFVAVSVTTYSSSLMFVAASVTTSSSSLPSVAVSHCQ